MPNYINLIMPLTSFLGYTKEIADRLNVRCYIRKRNIVNDAFYEKISLDDIQKDVVLDVEYSDFFFCSKEIDLKSKVNVYNEYSHYSIEGNGGRETHEEIEVISLRIISKTPDKNIKLFADALNDKLKKDLNFGRGVICGTKNIRKDYFYLKDIKDKKIWIDLRKRLVPCKIA